MLDANKPNKTPKILIFNKLSEPIMANPCNFSGVKSKGKIRKSTLELWLKYNR